MYYRNHINSGAVLPAQIECNYSDCKADCVWASYYVRKYLLVPAFMPLNSSYCERLKIENRTDRNTAEVVELTAKSACY